MESVQKDIECYFGRLKQQFKILKTPILLHKKKIDDMIFTIVAIQNIILDYMTAADFHASWMVQLNWQQVDMENHDSHKLRLDLLEKLVVAKEEDINEEDDPVWFRPRVKKKIGKVWVT
jgi:hypothetical protein